MGGAIQFIAKKLANVITTELGGRQADIVDNKQANIKIIGSIIMIWRNRSHHGIKPMLINCVITLWPLSQTNIPLTVCNYHSSNILPGRSLTAPANTSRSAKLL